MLQRLREHARDFDRTIGWSRFGLLLSVTIIAIAIVVLYRMLHTLHVDQVILALKAIDPQDVIVAGICVAAGYFTLTFYDLFALRTIGHPEISYRSAALAGFTSYSIGHNIGASIFTGGAVRYRIYSASGLDAVAVAKLCFIAGLTFWLGNATVLGLGVLYDPQAATAVDQLPPLFNRIGAIVILAILMAYVVWVWLTPRVFGRSNWTVALPSGPSTLLQIAIGIVDLSFCAMAMYVLLPDEPNVGFISLAVIFVSATLLGFASSAPGGLGVFDAAMLVALWQFDKDQLLAGLLLFRLLYYVVPFALALIVLGIRELIVTIPAPKTRPDIGFAPSAGSEAHDPNRKTMPADEVKRRPTQQP